MLQAKSPTAALTQAYWEQKALAAPVTAIAVISARRQSNLIERNFVTDLVTECLR